LESQPTPSVPEQRSFWGGRKDVVAPAEVPAEVQPPARGGRKKSAPRKKQKDTPLT
jgi:hypothetical protein